MPYAQTMGFSTTSTVEPYGNDRIFGDAGNDQLFGDDGDDQLFGGDGDDQLFGGIGNDQLVGGAGNDQLFGEDGNDTLSGGAGNDQLFGDNGNDQLVAGLGNDALSGGAGNDILNGVDPTVAAPGRNEIDTLIGGVGADTLILGDNGNSSRSNPAVYYLGGGNNDYALITDFNPSEGDRIQLAANTSGIPNTAAEAGDAGQTLTTAQVIPGGTARLDSITGAISPNNDVDIYQITVGSGGFSATTVGGATFDTQLFLFNSSGSLISSNDDSVSLQSTITSNLAAGDYYLAISSYNNDPVGTPPTFPGSGGSGGSYTISLTGVQAAPATYSLGATPAGVPQGTGLFFCNDLIADIVGVSPSSLSLSSPGFVFV